MLLPLENPELLFLLTALCFVHFNMRSASLIHCLAALPQRQESTIK